MDKHAGLPRRRVPWPPGVVSPEVPQTTMAEIQIQPKSAKRTKGLGRPDTVGEPSSVRIMKAAAAAVGTPWLRTLTYGHHDDRTPTHS
jgi:hypothetical protein